MAQHPPDVRQKPHVEHAIGFVEDEVLQPAELGVRHGEMVEQAAGRGDDDVDAAAEGVLLRTHADAAEDGRGGHRRVHGKVVQVLDDLRRQLASRRQHERARGAARLVDQPMQNRQQERRRLAAAGRRACEQVAAGQRERNRVGLNRGRSGEAEIFQTPKKARMEGEAAKRHEAL